MADKCEPEKRKPVNVTLFARMQSCVNKHTQAFDLVNREIFLEKTGKLGFTAGGGGGAQEAKAHGKRYFV